MQPDESLRTISANSGADGWWLDDGSGRIVEWNLHAGSKLLHTVKIKAPALNQEHTLVTYETYDHMRPTKIVAMDGLETHIVYNNRGQPINLDQRRGITIKNQYEIEYDDLATSSSYGQRKKLKRLGGTAPITTEFQYDQFDRIWKIIAPDALITTLGYDAIGGNILASLDRVTSVTHPDEKTEHVVWENLDVKEAWDIENKKTAYTYNGNRRVTKVETPDGKSIQYDYGSCCADIDTLVDAAGNKTHWKYDVLGRVTEKWLNWETSIPGGAPAVRVKWNQYDSVGRAVTTTDARGNLRSIVYDALGRMTDIQYAVQLGTAPTPDVHIDYEALAESLFMRPKQVQNTDATWMEQYTYVPVNPADGVYGDGNLATVNTVSKHSVSYTYDFLGRVAGRSLEVGTQSIGSVTSAWDDLGRLTSVSNPLGTEEIHYHEDTRRVTWTKIKSLRTDYEYNTDVVGEHRLEKIENKWGTNAASYTKQAYGYDAVGRLESWSRTLGANVTQWTMGYDASEQLETVDSATNGTSNGLEFYQYDDAGNRISEQRGGTVRKWGRNQLNQLTQYQLGGAMELRGGAGVKSNVTVRELDQNNNPVGQAVAATPPGGAVNWKARVNVGVGNNKFKVEAVQAEVPQGTTAQSTTRILSVPLGSIGSGDGAVTPIQYDADGNMTSDGIRSYEWDAENRLVRVAGSAIGEVTFTYDPYHRRTRLVERFGSQTVADRTLRWAGLEIVGERIVTNGGFATEDRYYYSNGETRKQTGSATTVELLYTRDHLGSIRELVDASNGNVRAHYDYTPYGIRTKLGGDLDADFGFTGHYTNARSGLVLAPYRAYSPELGRWISRDPIEEDGGINLYGYVGNGPLQAVDPLGLVAFALPHQYAESSEFREGYHKGMALPFVVIGEAIGSFASSFWRGFNEGLAEQKEQGVGPLLSGFGGRRPKAGRPPVPIAKVPSPPAAPRRVTNPKHHPNSKTPEPKNCEDLWQRSVLDGNGSRYALDDNGVIHRFSDGNDGTFHWSGSNHPRCEHGLHQNQMPSRETLKGLKGK